MMCIFGGGGAAPASNAPESKGPSSQTTPNRADESATPRTGTVAQTEAAKRAAQLERDPLGRGTSANGVGTKAPRKGFGGTLLTAGMAADTTGKKTLLGA